MGYSHYSHHDAGVRATLRSTGMRPRMAYDADVRQGRAERVTHKAMDPKGKTREARDSAAHPNSVPIAIWFDQTGSMGAIPSELQMRLGNLMRLLTERDFVTDPQVLFGAFGDATCDFGGYLQVGQFESGLEMDDDLDKLWLVGQGGGQFTESYELAYYFTARHFVTDAWEKRQKKGYCFTIGDEMPYQQVNREQVRRIIGDGLQTDIELSDIITEASQKWHLFHLIPQTPTGMHESVESTWKSLLPAGHVLKIQNADNVAEVIGLIVGLCEGKVTEVHNLDQLGLNHADMQAVIAAIRPLAAARGIRLRDTTHA